MIRFVTRFMIRLSPVIWLMTLAVAPAQSASLTVSPIGLTIAAPDSSSRLIVRNDNQRPVTIQVRVFKWAINGSRDDYQETRDVVVSPPIATIGPRSELHVRVIRISKAPVRGEENFRIVVDEVPDANRVRNVGVNIALRYTLPLFFLEPTASQPRVTWAIRQQGKSRVLVATNTGDKHLRVANLNVGGVTIRKGLAGYVLGRSTRTFELPPRASGATVTADTSQGRLNARIEK